MKFSKHPRLGHSLRLFHVVLPTAMALTIAACASAPTKVKMEPKSMAKRLGFPDCRVSVPLNESEVIEDAKKVGNPSPEKNLEWIEITKSIQAGDQLRVVNCLSSSRSTYFYVLIRDNSVVSEFYSSIFD